MRRYGIHYPLLNSMLSAALLLGACTKQRNKSEEAQDRFAGIETTRDLQSPRRVASSGDLIWEYVVDPYQTDLNTNLAFVQPHAILYLEPDQLIVSDRSAGIVVRLSTDGRFLELIGGRGNGPGEFWAPSDLVFDPDTSRLWVVDRLSCRVSRFQLRNGSFEFLDSFRAPAIYGDTFGGGIVLDGPSSMWITPRGSDQIIAQVDDQGEVKASFGSPWIPEEVRNRRFSVTSFNFTYLLSPRPGLLTVIWQLRPYFEVWSTSGECIATVGLTWPEIEMTRQDAIPEEAPGRFYVQGVASVNGRNLALV